MQQIKHFKHVPCAGSELTSRVGLVPLEAVLQTLLKVWTVSVADNSERGSLFEPLPLRLPHSAGRVEGKPARPPSAALNQALKKPKRGDETPLVVQPGQRAVRRPILFHSAVTAATRLGGRGPWGRRLFEWQTGSANRSRRTSDPPPPKPTIPPHRETHSAFRKGWSTSEWRAGSVTRKVTGATATVSTSARWREPDAGGGKLMSGL